MKKLFVLLMSVLLVVSLAACGDNKLEKVEEQLQGRWVYLLMDEAGVGYEFLDGKASALLYLNGIYTVANTGKYTITDDTVDVTYDFAISIDANGNTIKKEGNGEVAIRFKYTFEDGVLKLFYESGTLSGEMIKK